VRPLIALSVLAAVCAILLGLSLFCITGRPESVHIWWDRGDRDCVRCKLCGGCEFIVEGIHAQPIHHPRMYRAGLGLGGATILIPAMWLAWVMIQERRRSAAS